MTARIFLIDDDESLRRVLSKELTRMNFEVESFASSRGVVRAAEKNPPEAILLDLKMPGKGGLELLADLKACNADLQILVLTGHGSVQEAVEAMRAGARDFLTKPVQLEVLRQALRRAQETYRLLCENRQLKRAASTLDDSQELLGSSPQMAELRRAVERTAPTNKSILIQGENGTGKEMVARNLHLLSDRRDKPFVVVNCGAIPESLIESELFGHERGAFTGAERKRIGLFEAAHEGTIFLDEIGELPTQVQPTLLRTLQFGEIKSVGSDVTRKIDVRVVAATNRDLLEMVEDQDFREDLYYRVAILHLELPPLRERPEDIRPISEFFLKREAMRSNRSLHLCSEGYERLRSHAWPGNVRELENAIIRLSVMAEKNELDADMVDRYILRRQRSSDRLPTLCLADLERKAILAAMKQHDDSKKAAAETLGIALKTLYNKLERYDQHSESTSPSSKSG